VGIDRGYQKCGSTGPHTLGIKGIVDPLNTPLPQMCYHAEFDHYMSNGTSVKNREREKMEKNWALHVPPFKVTLVHRN